VNWYKKSHLKDVKNQRFSQQKIDAKQALKIEKWIIAIAKQMYNLFISFSGGEFRDDEDDGYNDYRKYMERINPLVKVMKIYIDKLKGYPTISKGAERSIVETSKKVVGNLTSTDSHNVINLLQGLFATVGWAYPEKI